MFSDTVKSEIFFEFRVKSCLDSDGVESEMHFEQSRFLSKQFI